MPFSRRKRVKRWDSFGKRPRPASVLEPMILKATVAWVKADIAFTSSRETHSKRHSWVYRRARLRELVSEYLDAVKVGLWR